MPFCQCDWSPRPVSLNWHTWSRHAVIGTIVNEVFKRLFSKRFMEFNCLSTYVTLVTYKYTYMFYTRQFVVFSLGSCIFQHSIHLSLLEIRMKCVGWGEVHWTQTIQSVGPGQKPKSETIHINGEESYFKSVIALYGKGV